MQLLVKSIRVAIIISAAVNVLRNEKTSQLWQCTISLAFIAMLMSMEPYICTDLESRKQNEWKMKQKADLQRHRATKQTTQIKINCSHRTKNG